MGRQNSQQLIIPTHYRRYGLCFSLKLQKIAYQQDITLKQFRLQKTFKTVLPIYHKLVRFETHKSATRENCARADCVVTIFTEYRLFSDSKLY